MRQQNNCQNSDLQNSKNKHEQYCWSFKDFTWIAENVQFTFIRIRRWKIYYHQYLNLEESENKHECYCWLSKNSMLALLKENFKNTMMHSESDIMHCMKKWSNSTTRMLLLRREIIVRI